MLAGRVRDALAETGDVEVVAGLLDTVLRRGNGAAAQRAEYRRSSRLTDVITAAAAITTGA